MNDNEFRDLLSLYYCTERVLTAVDADPTLTNRVVDGSSLLQCAIWWENGELARALLDRGASVDQRDDTGKDALMLTTLRFDLGFELVEHLLRCGSDVLAVDRNLRSAVWYAAAIGWKEVVMLLISKGAALDHADDKGVDALGSYRAYHLDFRDDSDEGGLEDENRKIEEILSAFREGPHPSQVIRRKWERRLPAIMFAAENGFQQTLSRQLEAMALKVEPHESIPDIPESPKQKLQMAVFGNSELWREIVSFL